MKFRCFKAALVLAIGFTAQVDAITIDRDSGMWRPPIEKGRNAGPILYERPPRPIYGMKDCCGGDGLDKLSIASTLSSLKGNNCDSASCGDRKEGLQNLHDKVKNKAEQQLKDHQETLQQLDKIKEEMKNPGTSDGPCGYSCCKAASVLDPYCPTGCYADKPRCLQCRHFGAKTMGRDDGSPADKPPAPPAAPGKDGGAGGAPGAPGAAPAKPGDAAGKPAAAGGDAKGNTAAVKGAADDLAKKLSSD